MNNNRSWSASPIGLSLFVFFLLIRQVAAGWEWDNERYPIWKLALVVGSLCSVFVAVRQVLQEKEGIKIKSFSFITSLPDGSLARRLASRLRIRILSKQEKDDFQHVFATMQSVYEAIVGAEHERFQDDWENFLVEQIQQDKQAFLKPLPYLSSQILRCFGCGGHDHFAVQQWHPEKSVQLVNAFLRSRQSESSKQYHLPMVVPLATDLNGQQQLTARQDRLTVLHDRYHIDNCVAAVSRYFNAFVAAGGETKKYWFDASSLGRLQQDFDLVKFRQADLIIFYHCQSSEIFKQLGVDIYGDHKAKIIVLAAEIDSWHNDPQLLEQSRTSPLAEADMAVEAKQVDVEQSVPSVLSAYAAIYKGRMFASRLAEPDFTFHQADQGVDPQWLLRPEQLNILEQHWQQGMVADHQVRAAFALQQPLVQWVNMEPGGEILTETDGIDAVNQRLLEHVEVHEPAIYALATYMAASDLVADGLQELAGWMPGLDNRLAASSPQLWRKNQQDSSERILCILQRYQLLSPTVCQRFRLRPSILHAFQSRLEAAPRQSMTPLSIGL